MKTTFDSINYIIKRLVEYQVKQKCADIHTDGTPKLLSLHSLSAAKNLAYELGHHKEGIHFKEKDVTCHMRSLKDIRELNYSMASDIIHYINDNSELYTSNRFIIDENGKTERIDIWRYFNDDYANDSIILFLVENDYAEIIKKEKPTPGNESAHKLRKLLKETPEQLQERNHRESISKRQKDDDAIKSGRCIAAVEVRPSISTVEYTDSNSGKIYSWRDFRKSFNELISNKENTESYAYKHTTLDSFSWRVACCETVVELFQQYALKNIDDSYFMSKLVENLPESVVFKNDEDYNTYEENEKKLDEFRKTLTYPTMYKL